MAVSVVGVLILALLGWTWSGGERADFAGWLEAISTLAALAAATVAGALGVRAIRIEQERDGRALVDQRSAQAAQVSAWFVRTVTEEVDGTAMLSGVGIRIRNVSALPVTRVLLHARLLWTTPTGQEAYTDLVAHEMAVLPPFDPTDGLTEPVLKMHQIAVPANPRVEVELHFVDASGTAWTREADGRLVEGA
jgi:hypothetical protein